MKIINIHRALVTTAAFMLFSLSAEANTCKDDPRMYTIKSVIDSMEAGEDVKPMKLTAKTFLELTSTVRSKLGDNIRVFDEACVPVQIFEGQIAKPIYMPFPVIEQGLHRAAMRKDFATMNIIFQQFRASASPASKIIYMARPLFWTNDALNALYETGIMERLSAGTLSSGDSDISHCGKVLSPITQIDLFAKLGGRVDTPETLIFLKYRYGADNNVSFGLMNANASYAPRVFQKIGTEIEECAAFNWARTLSAYATSGMLVQSYTEADLADAISAHSAKQQNTGL
jgi:hypothetical protein